MIQKTNFREQPLKETPHKVDVRKLYDKTSAEVIHITLQPGEALKPHKTPVDVFFYILEGTPLILVGDEQTTGLPDDIIESPANIIHNISNPADIKARILVVKAPKPTSASKIL